MSDLFHKSTYMARSAGYKYRTLSTNTGEKKRRDSHEDNTIQKKLRELKKTIHNKIQNEVDQMADARDAILEKFHKIDSKIDSLIEVQNTVLGLREDIHQADTKLAEMLVKVDKIELAINGSELYSLQSRKSSYRSQHPTILEEKEIFQSNITHV